MKIRTGFVSNSSSSSFVCWGVHVDKIKISDETYLKGFDELLASLTKSVEENKDKERKYYWFEEDAKNLKLMEKCNNNEEKLSFIKEYYSNNLEDIFDSGEFEVGGQEYQRYVGLTPDQITFQYPELKVGEIKKFVAEKLNKHFGSNYTEKDIEYTEQGWYNG